MLTPETRGMLAWFPVYFATYPEHDEVDVDALKQLIKLRLPAGTTQDSLDITMQYAEMLRRPVNESDIKGVLGTMYELDFAGKAGALLAAFNRGEEVDVIHELEVIARAAKKARSNSKASDYVDPDIDAILRTVADDKGIKFRRHPDLFESVAGLQGGSSVAVGAFVDAGKTSLVADFITDWAPQCVDFFGGDRPILWLNNEGAGVRILPRIYQAALGMNVKQIGELSRQGLLIPSYEKAIGAPYDYIRVKDVHGSSMSAIEQVIEDMNPCVIVADMMANIHMGIKSGNKTEAVEAAWQEWREILVRYNAIGIGTIQLSVEGTDTLHPPLTALKDTKIGAQGAFELCILMGNRLNIPELQHVRGISTPKNKLGIPGKPGYVRSECVFDPEISRFNYGTAGTYTAAKPPLAPAANMVP